MVPFSVLLNAVIPVFLLIGLGTLARRLRWVTAEGEPSLMQLVIKILYPCMIFHFIVGNEAISDPRNLFGAPALGFYSIAAGILIAYLLAPLFRLKKGSGRRSFAVASGIYNFGYIAIPVTQVVFDEEVVGILLVFNVGIELAIWTVGVLVFNGSITKENLKKALSPPVIAMFIAVPLNLTGAVDFIPTALMTVIGLLANCLIPIGLFMIGASLLDLFQELPIKRALPYAFGGIVMRIGILPFVILAPLVFLPDLSPELRSVLIIQCAMPSGVFPIVMAKYYNGQPSVALAVVLGTCSVAIFTIPLWLKFAISMWGTP